MKKSINKNQLCANIKEIFKSLTIFLAIATIVLTVHSPALAQVEGSGFVQQTLGEIAQPTKLPSFETSSHAEASYEFGASNITSAIFYAVDMLKYLMGTVAVLVIIVSGIRLITAGKKIEEVSSQQKENIKYAMIGLIIIVLADVMVKQAFFGQQGEVYRTQADIQAAAENTTAQLRGVYNFLEIFAGAIAVLMIVIAGFCMVTSGGQEETMTKSTKQIMWAVAGLVVIGISELAVKNIIFPDQGSRIPDVEQTKALIVNITNFISGFVATVAIGFYMYGGFLYVTAAGKEDNPGKAKKVFLGATIGLLLALAAFAIVNTLITFGG